MKRRVKVYLDTSAISAVFDERNPERKSLTEVFFKEMRKFEPYISEITLAEIERTPDLELQNKMKGATSPFLVLSSTDDVEWLPGSMFAKAQFLRIIPKMLTTLLLR